VKIKPDDLAKLRTAITPLDTPERRARYLAGDFHNAERVRDLNKRYRWDLLYASSIKIGDGVGIKGDIDLYYYADDMAVDTALRSIVKPLTTEGDAS
jgi:hypothetical protein